MKDLNELKKEYSKIQKKHSLPSFDDLNRDFAIEKLSENETDFLLREVRSFVSNSVDNFVRYIEGLLNPTNAPLFIFSILNSLDEEGKKKLKEIHKKLSDLEIDYMKLLLYSEEKEANFINKAYLVWQDVKRDFVKTIESAEKRIDSKKDKKNNAYFG